MRVVVSGATGLIGRELTKGLLSDGYEVVALTRDRSRAERALGRERPGLRIEAWDGVRLGSWASAVEGASAVVNLAGENVSGRWTKARKRALPASRLEATAVLCEALRRAAAPSARFIQASAVGFYGDRGDEELVETSRAGSGFLASIASEGRIEALAPAGLSVAIIRTGIVLGSEGGALPRLALPFRFGAGFYPGRGGQWVSWIALLDEVRAIRFLLERPDLRGCFNLTAPAPATMKELCAEIGRRLGRKLLLPLPGFAARLFFGEMADEALLSGQRVLPARLLEHRFRFELPTVGEAVAAALRR